MIQTKFENNLEIHKVTDKVNFSDYKDNCLNIIPIKLSKQKKS